MTELVDIGLRDKIHLFYTKHNSVLCEKLSMNIVREVCGYLDISMLFACLKPNTSMIEVHNLASGSSSSLVLPETIPGGIGYCQIFKNTLLCVGGFSAANSAKLIDFASGSLTPTANMHYPRHWPGIIPLREFVYVFGGNTNGTLKSCEKFHISERCWTRCPDMHFARVCFTPCLHRGEIYLADTGPSLKQLEVFTPSTELYRLLPLHLESQSYGAVSFFAGDELLIVRYQMSLARWKLGGSDELQWTPFATNRKGFTNCAPVRYATFVCWADSNGSIMKFDLQRQVLLDL